jgi:molybdate transport system substrate-binding protein
MRLPTVISLAMVLGMLAGTSAVDAATVNAAVAANFTKVATTLADKFKAETGNEVKLSFGASGALYTQITQGAPFDVFLSADDKRTKTAIKDGFGVDGTDFTYAIGRVALYSPTLDLTDGEAVLKEASFNHIAIADPKAAPYGAAGLATIDKLGLTDALAPKIVTGESITQALQFVDSGSAEIGFVALSQVVGKPAAQVWVVPEADYASIQQNAVLLKAGVGNDAAKAFLAYLKGDEAVAVIKAAGYAIP